MKPKVQEKHFIPKNSSMATNLEEVKNLGKQMENMKTNKELLAEDKQPDPVQEANTSERNLR